MVRPCRFGDNCTTPECEFQHSASWSPEEAERRIGSVCCPWRARCYREACPFRHPPNWNPQKNYENRPCRYGARCDRPDCYFKHPLAKINLTPPKPVPTFGCNPKLRLFNKWSYGGIAARDLSLMDAITVIGSGVPHSAGRYQKRCFHKARIPIMERLVNGLMRKGRANGKKLQAVRILKVTLEIIALLTDSNPIQVVVDAIVNGGAREDSTRIGAGGVVRRQALDVAPLHRVNEAISMICIGARNSAFRSLRTLPECLADELIFASKDSTNSYAIKKKDETERLAKANR